MIFSQRICSLCSMVVMYFFDPEFAHAVRSSSFHLMNSNELETASGNKAKKPIWKRAFGITSKFEEADHEKILKAYGVNGDKLSVLLPGETLGMAYQKGKKDFLLMTPYRLLHIDGEKAKSALKRLAGDKGKVTYTTYPWPHISDFKITTLGAAEMAFDLNKETELEVKLSNNEWEKFEFDKKVNIIKVNKYFGDNMFQSKALVYADLPVFHNAKPLSYTAETTGRLKQISHDALPKAVSKTLSFTERILAAFSYKKMFSASHADYVVLTNKRLMDIDRQGASKLELVSHSFSPQLKNAISAFSVTTAGGFDLDSEMFVEVYGVGRFDGDFTRNTDTLALYKQLNEWVLSPHDNGASFDFVAKE